VIQPAKDDMDDDLVFYSYKCAECGHAGSVHLAGHDHEDQQSNCNACGAMVWLQWDGGVTFRLASGKQADRGES
jgi:predicted nucleic acid-binding Zn ribbon protein